MPQEATSVPTKVAWYTKHEVEMVVRLGNLKPYECPCCGVKTHTTTNKDGAMVTYHGDPRCPFYMGKPHEGLVIEDRVQILNKDAVVRITDDNLPLEEKSHEGKNTVQAKNGMRAN